MVNQSVCSLMQAAKTKRSHSSYIQELEHASSPLSARAWLGVVRERQEEWRKSHTPWRYGHHGNDQTNHIGSSKLVRLFFPADLLELAVSMERTLSQLSTTFYCSLNIWKRERYLLMQGRRPCMRVWEQSSPQVDCKILLVQNDYHTFVD